MADFEAGPLAEVTVRQAENAWTLVFVRDLAHPPAKVWRALTEADQLGAWAPFLADRDLTTPGAAVLTVIDGDARMASSATVIRVEEPTLLEYSWGDDLLRWELVGLDAGTRLTLAHTHAERDLLPKLAAGWHLCLAVAERLLAGHPVPPIRGRDAMNFGWAELNEAYAAELGGPGTSLPD